MAEGGKDILTSNHLDAPSTSSGSALSKKSDNKDFFSPRLTQDGERDLAATTLHGVRPQYSLMNPVVFHNNPYIPSIYTPR